MTTAQLQQQNLCPVGIYVLSVNDRKLFEQADGQTVRDWLGALSGGNASGAATSQSSGGTTTATTPATTAP